MCAHVNNTKNKGVRHAHTTKTSGEERGRTRGEGGVGGRSPAARRRLRGARAGDAAWAQRLFSSAACACAGLLPAAPRRRRPARLSADRARSWPKAARLRTICRITPTPGRGACLVAEALEVQEQRRRCARDMHQPPRARLLRGDGVVTDKRRERRRDPFTGQGHKPQSGEQKKKAENRKTGDTVPGQRAGRRADGPARWRS